MQVCKLTGFESNTVLAGLRANALLLVVATLICSHNVHQRANARRMQVTALREVQYDGILTKICDLLRKSFGNKQFSHNAAVMVHK